MFLISTLFHSQRDPRIREWYGILDHAAIFIFIAGTYTPVTLLGLRGTWGLSLFILIWCLALLGILTMVLFAAHRVKFLPSVVYCLMDWLILFAFQPLTRALPAGGVKLLVAGGVTYTMGILFFYANGIPNNHVIWHFLWCWAACYTFWRFFSTFFRAEGQCPRGGVSTQTKRRANQWPAFLFGV